jgi:hypothetical protein
MENLMCNAIVQASGTQGDFGSFMSVFWHWAFWAAFVLGVVGSVAAFFVIKD